MNIYRESAIPDVDDIRMELYAFWARQSVIIINFV
jgi:hypothetical protein